MRVFVKSAQWLCFSWTWTRLTTRELIHVTSAAGLRMFSVFFLFSWPCRLAVRRPERFPSGLRRALNFHLMLCKHSLRFWMDKEGKTAWCQDEKNRRNRRIQTHLSQEFNNPCLDYISFGLWAPVLISLIFPDSQHAERCVSITL